MPLLKIYLNKSVNPSRLTPDGYYCLNYHSFHLVCESSEKKLYNKYGWYLGNIVIGSDNLEKLTRKEFQTILNNIETKIDQTINQKDNLLPKIQQKIAEILSLINTSLPNHISKLKVNQINIKSLVFE